jgi:hypothetical protein
MKGDNNGQADGNFSRRHSESKEHEHLPSDIVKVFREGHKVDIRGIQHQFDGQQNDDDVAAN